MISDFHKALTLRTITLASDSAGQFTESTSDTTIYGYIAEMSGSEMLKSHQLGIDATAELYTESSLSLKDRIVDGAIVYEIVYAYSNFHNRYPLKRER